MPRPSVILFRTSHQEDAFEVVFEERNWEVRSIPVLSFSYQNEDKLKTCLQAAASYSGIIVTSPRAGDVLAERLSMHEALRDKWKQKTIFCIGKRSAAQLIKCGLVPRIADLADASVVARMVISFGGELPWLFLCGNLRRDELPALLTEATVPFEEVQVYQTHPHKEISFEDISQPEWIAFFSPSGIPTVQENWPASWGSVRKAAIGSTTARAIEQAGWKVEAIARKPEAKALFDAITRNT
ncbi:MAG: uroporphyrinogen-III synthase [Rhodothermales bacterium]